MLRMMFCSDLRYGAVCSENLGIQLSHQWQAARRDKFTDLIDKTVQNNAAYVALFGQLFGQKRISEAIIDRLFETVKAEAGIKVLAFLNKEEYSRIAYRNDIPNNLFFLCPQKQDSYLDDYIAVKTDNAAAAIQLAYNNSLLIQKNSEDRFVISDLNEEYVLPSFEPVGFEDAHGLTCGYSIIEWYDEEFGQYTYSEDQKYVYKSIVIKLFPEDDQKEIIRKINASVNDVGFDTFLRITLTGRTAFATRINSEALKARMQNRVFYAEIYDNTEMDIDETAFENDISLSSEFVRLAMQDDSLSESERNRLICCGWNALKGGEVSLD